MVLASTIASGAEQVAPLKVRRLFDEGLAQVDFFDPRCSIEESIECVVFSLACDGQQLRVSMPGLMESALEFTREEKGHIAIDGEKTKLFALEAAADSLNGGWVLTAYSHDISPIAKIAVAKQLEVDFGVPVKTLLSKEAKSVAGALSTLCAKQSS
ncbi:hypothetical protein [Kaistia adipata]|uniref:hypothetical protein n=1 Tax=Kaistia adipata TaxID=166954 RepID=UPI0012EBADC8|nr:hypothetical protein [Kaistia adipata]